MHQGNFAIKTVKVDFSVVCVLHQDELMQNWELSKDGKPLNRINPLV